MSNKILNAEILQVVENQIKSNNPPETKQTYKRLIASGMSEKDAKIHIGRCVAIEIYTVVKEQKPFNEKRFIANLNKLPGEPF